MNKLILTIALVCGFTFATQAQEVQAECCTSDSGANTKGDWYIGTGDISNVAWTDWSIAPTVGYGVTDELMFGCSLGQADSTVDLSINIHARYFYKGYFAYVGTEGLNLDAISIGAGKMFTIKDNIYIDPKLVYNTGEGTTNLTLGFGLRF